MNCRHSYLRRWLFFAVFEMVTLHAARFSDFTTIGADQHLGFFHAHLRDDFGSERNIATGVGERLQFLQGIHRMTDAELSFSYCFSMFGGENAAEAAMMAGAGFADFLDCLL